MIRGLLGIKFNLGKAQGRKVQNLACYINEEALEESHKGMAVKKAKGIDGITKDEYAIDLKENLERLVRRMKDGSYKPKASRRAYVPKDGSNKMRPLGISSYEDKLVENAIAKILTMVYEPKFYGESYGFRPGRNCHQAVREVIEDIQYRNTNYVVEADIKGFFDNVNHEWMMKFLEHDIADKKFLELIKKFLKAGIMEDGKLLESDKGTPQGNGASPLLANIYLHYVLDTWFVKLVKRQCKGEAYLIRYCDDFVCCFQYGEDAEKFYQSLIERFKKFNLELALEKTKILEFGKFANGSRTRRGLGRPETFDFLGFTFYCSENGKKEFFRCKVKTSKKKFRVKIKRMKEWIKKNRTLKIKEIIEKINRKLIGHYQYYGVTDNMRELQNYRNVVIWMLYKWINRRSQRRSYNCKSFFKGLLKTLPIAEPRIYVSLFYR